MKGEFKNLPSGWRVVRLGEICNVKQGLQIPISERFCENAQNRYFYITNEFLKEKSEVKYYIENPPEGTICFCDDILMTRTGNTGMVVTNVFGVFHNNFFKIAYDRQLIKKEYFVFLLTGPKIQNEIFKRAGSSTIPDLNHGDFLSIKISIPPLDEQEKIAEILSTWDEAINLTINLIENKKQFKKALMQNLLTAKIRFPQFKDEWREIKLGEILKEHKIKSDNKSDVFSVSVHKGIVNQIEHLGRSFSAEDTSNYNLVKPFDLVYTKSPTGDFPFGIIKQNLNPFNVIVSPLYGVFEPINKFLGTLLHYFFESSIRTNNYLQPIIQKGAKNTINISNDTFLSRSILVPINLNEQQKIAEVLTACDDEINLLNLKLENLKKQKQGLMQKLLKGEIRTCYVKKAM